MGDTIGTSFGGRIWSGANGGTVLNLNEGSQITLSNISSQEARAFIR